MKRNTSSEDLIYVSTGENIYVYTLDGQSVGMLTGFQDSTGLCSDKSGNVRITNANYSYSYDDDVVEYSHGGTSPIATLEDPDYPDARSVDPGSGNLAVGDLDYNIAIFIGAQGLTGILFDERFMEDVRTITYDGSGDLYFRSGRYRKSEAWLPSGGSKVMTFDLTGKPSSYQWDGKYLTTRTRNPQIGRWKVKGSQATLIGTLPIHDCRGTDISAISPASQRLGDNYTIEGSKLIAACGTQDAIAIYNYPAGGDPLRSISIPSYAAAVTVSVAPSSDRRKH